MPTCTSISALIGAQPCFAGTTLNARERKSLLIWFRANELAAVGGTNYTTTLASTLISDATTFAGNAYDSINTWMDGSEFNTAQLVIEKNNAVAAGATISSNINTLMASIAPLSKATQWQLDAALLMLMCKLGKHTGT